MKIEISKNKTSLVLPSETEWVNSINDDPHLFPTYPSYSGWYGKGFLENIYDGDGNRIKHIEYYYSTDDYVSKDTYPSITGRILFMLDQNGKMSEYNYDTVGREVTIKSKYPFDSDSNVEETTTLKYDDRGNLISSEILLLVKKEGYSDSEYFEYCQSSTYRGFCVANFSTDKYGNTTFNIIDKNGNIIEKIDPYLNSKTYNGNNLIEQQTDEIKLH